MFGIKGATPTPSALHHAEPTHTQSNPPPVTLSSSPKGLKLECGSRRLTRVAADTYAASLAMSPESYAREILKSVSAYSSTDRSAPTAYTAQASKVSPNQPRVSLPFELKDVAPVPIMPKLVDPAPIVSSASQALASTSTPVRSSTPVTVPAVTAAPAPAATTTNVVANTQSAPNTSTTTTSALSVMNQGVFTVTTSQSQSQQHTQQAHPQTQPQPPVAAPQPLPPPTVAEVAPKPVPAPTFQSAASVPNFSAMPGYGSYDQKPQASAIKQDESVGLCFEEKWG